MNTHNNMTTPQNNGGAAFPHEAVKWNSDAGVYEEDCENYHPGMTLRDWFAGQALAICQDHMVHANMAAEAYKIANAMLAARKERQEP